MPHVCEIIPLRRKPSLSNVPAQTLADMLQRYTQLETERNRIDREMAKVQAEFQQAIGGQMP